MFAVTRRSLNQRSTAGASPGRNSLKLTSGIGGRIYVTGLRLAPLPPLGYLQALRLGREAPPGEQQPGGAHEDAHVEPQRTVIDVPDVQRDSLLPVERPAAVDLGPAGQPRLHLKAAALLGRVELHLRRDRWSRADDRHLPADDIDEVRQL